MLASSLASIKWWLSHELVKACMFQAHTLKDACMNLHRTLNFFCSPSNFQKWPTILYLALVFQYSMSCMKELSNKKAHSSCASWLALFWMDEIHLWGINMNICRFFFNVYVRYSFSYYFVSLEKLINSKTINVYWMFCIFGWQ
jgi:hypothetical protein